MSTTGHAQTCRCSLHVQLDARRHECYRRLAQAILGPAAPSEDAQLARALADRTRLLAPTRNLKSFRSLRAA